MPTGTPFEPGDYENNKLYEWLSEPEFTLLQTGPKTWQLRWTQQTETGRIQMTGNGHTIPEAMRNLAEELEKHWKD